MNIYLEILLWAVAIDLVHYILAYYQNKKQKEYGVFFGKKVFFGFSFGKRARTIFGCSFGEQALTVVGFSFGKYAEAISGFSFGKETVTLLGFSFGKESAVAVFGISFSLGFIDSGNITSFIGIGARNFSLFWIVFG